MLITNAHAFVNGKFTDNTSIRILNEQIVEINQNLVAEDNEDTIDINSDYLLPGFIDVHTHAYGGHDVMQGEASVRFMSRAYRNIGVAAFLPTTMSATPEETAFALDGIKNVMDSPECGGAHVAGAHMETPFLNPAKCGAQRKECFLSPSPITFDNYFGQFTKIIRLITIAPELEGATDFIKHAIQCGIHVSAGHTCADAETVHKAADSGLNHSTHTFNAQPAIHHRAPGCTVAALTDERIFCELICDGMHLHPDIVHLILRCKGKEKAVAITDSMEAAGMPDGEYSLGGQRVLVANGKATLADGTLAGSTLTMKTAFTNMISWGIPAETAAWMCTTAPADSIGLFSYGRISTGCCGLLTRWDKDWNLIEVIG